MPYYNEQLPEKMKARELAWKMGRSWRWWALSNVIPVEDVNCLIHEWSFFDSYSSKDAQVEYLAKCARLGVPRFMDGWGFEGNKEFRTVEAIVLAVGAQVAIWNEDAAENNEDPSNFYDEQDVERTYKWLGSHPFLFWLLGHVLEHTAKSWAEDAAVSIATTDDKWSRDFVDLEELRIEIEKTKKRFFDVYLANVDNRG